MATLEALLAALDSTDGTTRVTSVRQPAALKEALRLAVELGWASTSNDGLNQALREQLEVFARRRALDEHYAAHPTSRPSLEEVAIALAQLEHSPLAEQPSLIRRAAREVSTVRPDADADDVLLWAASLAHHTSASA